MAYARAVKKFSPRRFEEARVSLGLHQFTLAAELGISERSLQRFENGEGEPKLPVLTKLADMIGENLDWFFVEEAA